MAVDIDPSDNSELIGKAGEKVMVVRQRQDSFNRVEITADGAVKVGTGYTAPLPVLTAVSSGFNVKDYGAAGNDTANDNAAFTAARAAAIAAGGGNILVPPGVYKLTAAVDLGGINVGIIGLGPLDAVVLKQYTANVPILIVGGVFGQQTFNLGLKYATDQPAANTGANALLLRDLIWSEINNVKIEGAARCIYLEQAANSYFSSPGYNFAFSSSVRNIVGLRTSISCVDVKQYPYGGVGGTGGLWQNMYFNNNGGRTMTGPAFNFRSTANDVFLNINIEHADIAGPVFQFEQCLVDMPSIHVEDVTFTSPNYGEACMIHCIISTIHVGMLTASYNTFDPALDAGNPFAIIRTYGGRVDVDILDLNYNVRVGAAVVYGTYALNNIAAIVRVGQLSDPLALITVVDYQDAGIASAVLQQWGTARNALAGAIRSVLVDFGVTAQQSAQFTVTLPGVSAGSQIIASIASDTPSSTELKTHPLIVHARATAVSTVEITVVSTTVPITGQRRVNLITN